MAVKRGRQELDFRGTLGYIDRGYYASQFNRSLIASTFGETYRYTRPRRVQFHEEIIGTPAWNNPSAYAAQGSAGATFPFMQDFSLAVNTMDQYLHGVPTGYKKNSFQVSLGIAYTLP